LFIISSLSVLFNKKIFILGKKPLTAEATESRKGKSRSSGEYQTRRNGELSSRFQVFS